MAAASSSRSTASADLPGAAHPALDYQPLRMLVRIARQSRLGDPEGCAAVLSLLATGRLVRTHLQDLLASLDLTEAKFATLVTLYAVDPESSHPAELAAQARISRAAMTETLDSLRADGLVSRERGQTNRRTFTILLTDAGRDLAERAIRPFLTAIARCSDALSARERATLGGACAHLCEQFQHPPA